jgi:hypothetical protein
MHFDVKFAMAASEAILEPGSSYGALPIFMTQSSPIEAFEIVLEHRDSVVDMPDLVEIHVVVSAKGADCKCPELNLDNPGSELDRFKPGCSAAP